jgi:hypothetical protein
MIDGLRIFCGTPGKNFWRGVFHKNARERVTMRPKKVLAYGFP